MNIIQLMSETNESSFPERPYGKRSKTGKRMGRKPTKPPVEKKQPEIEKKTRKRRLQDSDLVKKAIMGLAKRQFTLDQIADVVGVSKTWLKENYQQEIKSGREVADALVVENLYQQAMKDTPASIQAGIYLTKARLGWKDKPDEDSRPQVVFNFGELSYEERQVLMEKIQEKKRLAARTIEGEIVSDE